MKRITVRCRRGIHLKASVSVSSSNHDERFSYGPALWTVNHFEMFYDSADGCVGEWRWMNVIAICPRSGLTWFGFSRDSRNKIGKKCSYLYMRFNPPAWIFLFHNKTTKLSKWLRVQCRGWLRGNRLHKDPSTRTPSKAGALRSSLRKNNIPSGSYSWLQSSNLGLFDSDCADSNPYW